MLQGRIARAIRGPLTNRRILRRMNEKTRASELSAVDQVIRRTMIAMIYFFCFNQDDLSIWLVCLRYILNDNISSQLA